MSTSPPCPDCGSDATQSELGLDPAFIAQARAEQQVSMSEQPPRRHEPRLIVVGFRCHACNYVWAPPEIGKQLVEQENQD